MWLGRGMNLPDNGAALVSFFTEYGLLNLDH